ncbi:MAG: hypothetical protein DMG07_16600 [Acidobacteria bacterium]|nr:MAG: hypothetical protein DMG07_16600 [Acidobacteriota bacterium]
MEEETAMARTVFLKPLTPEARAAIGGDALRIMAFPFRVGRESRPEARSDGAPSPFQRPSRPPNNELYLKEPGHVLNVSREHFLIDAQDGEYVLVDRGSVCGTLVEGDQIGSQRQGGSTRLSDQDVIVVGTSESRYIFKFVVLDAV